jgi:hypothetical protein
MSWILTLVVAVLTAVLGLLAGGTVAALAVDWYRISSFEGGSGYFIIFMALLGGAAGFLIGVAGSRMVAARPRPGFLKALLVCAAVVCAIAAVVAGTARLFADIPPRIEGETLSLLVEIRWPAAPGPAPSERTGIGAVHLGRAMGATVRREEDGPLFVDLARQEGGRWIVPGVVPIFTSRGRRLLRVGFDDDTLGGFVVPLPGHPTAAQRQWSDWLPHARPGDPPLPDGYTYRFKVVKESEPIREEAVGPFRVGTIAQYFYRTSEVPGYAVRATFRVGYGDEPIAGLGLASMVAVLGGPRPALLVAGHRPDGSEACHVVTAEENRPKLTPIAGCSVPFDAHRLTSNQETFRATRKRTTPEGWLDRTTMAEPGLYRMGGSIFDSRTLTAVPFQPPDGPSPVSGIPPLSLSPDEHSFAWLALDGSEDKPLLTVTNFVDGGSYALPIRREVMRYNTFDSLDPAWIGHHFEWRRADDGHDTLRERTAIVPLAYHGDLEGGKPGEYQSYTLRPGGNALREAMLKMLVETLGAERLPDALDGYLRVVRLEGHEMKLQVIETSNYVSLSMDNGDPEFMRRVASRLDAVVASGKYDAAFAIPQEPR